MIRTVICMALFYASAALSTETLELMIPPEAISTKMAEVAQKIDQDYKNEEITLIMVMKGAVCATADLMRHLKTPVTLEYLKASSYGERGTKAGTLTLAGLENLSLKGKNVLLVDDIFDTGNTMTSIVAELQKKEPKSIKSLVVFAKKVNRKTNYRPDYVMFDIDNHFIVGYGLDYKERYRGLPGIYIVKNAL